MAKNMKLNKAPNEMKKRGMWSELWHNFKKNPSAMVGLVVIGIIIGATMLVNYLFSE